MNKNKMSFLSASLLWFGAAISIAEILTGALLAPLGFGLGMLAIAAGHLIGCILLYFAGLIGAKSKVSAMESVRFSFGRYGSVFFSVLNILQLVGWTAVMIISGADAFGTVINDKFGFSGNVAWCALIGILIIIWIIAGLKNIDKLNNIAVIALLVLTAVLGVMVFKGGSGGKIEGSMTFGMALELAIAMPISWLPLISDYTKNTDKPVAFTLASTTCYFAGSCFMYAIGLGAVLFAGGSDVIQILMSAGLGVAAMLIVVFATVTTTFLDVYSAGESMLNIYPEWNGKIIGIVVSVVGTLIAIFTPVERYEDFLYLIGSVFVPMAAILITDYFILKKRCNDKKFDVANSILWVAGFVIYRVFLGIDTILGSTVPVVVIVMLLCITANIIIKKVE
ncbi:MAG: putative hydroxymethylpyrimidine transporter CytX [Caulobacteraceae bacterium]